MIKIDPPCFFSSTLSNMIPQGIYHGFFTRKGGVSKGVYSSLNAALHSKDSQQNILKNRQSIQNFFQHYSANAKLITAQQYHSNEIKIVTADNFDDLGSCDGLVTQEENLILGVLTADCGPVLLADPKNRVIAAVHAGWKGALNGILDNAIDAMCKLGANRENISGTLGPTISANHYEVMTDFKENFLEHNNKNEIYFKDGRDFQHFYFDLPRFILDCLYRNSVKLSYCNLCTFDLEKDFFSYRRATIKQENDYGRQLSAIMLDNKV